MVSTSARSGGVQRSSDPGEAKLWTEPLTDQTGNSLDQFRRHTRNFLDCIKSRELPISDLASAHRVATICHLANLGLRLGRSVAWDGSAQTIRGDDEAAARIERPYRQPWERERKAIVG